MNSHATRAAIVMERINQLASISEEEGCITRTYGTPAFIKGRTLVSQWMEQARLETSIDNIGNLKGLKRSAQPGARTFVIASHIDTIRNAGKFDGPLGVIAGIDIAQHCGELPFHLLIIAFADEEGCRFHSTYLGSHAVAGTFNPSMLSLRDQQGHSLKEIILSNGGQPADIASDAIPSEQWLGYFEMHIEQGPVLYTNQQPAAVVTAIAGQSRIQVAFEGIAGHAGTVPMHLRHDALACASECVLAIERFACDLDKNIVATVGKLDIAHPASNVIAGQVSMTIDLRSPDDSIRIAAYDAIHQRIQSICEKRKIGLNWSLVQQSGAIQCDTQLTRHLREALAGCGIHSPELVSGAGHDAVAISAVAPVSMLFVRCFEGISHNPLENVEPVDIQHTLAIAENFIKRLASA